VDRTVFRVRGDRDLPDWSAPVTARFADSLHEIRTTLGLAAPIVVGQLSQMLMGVLDSAMIGHAGTVPLAAASFANNVFNLFFVFGIGLMLPVAIFVARARGAGQPGEARAYLRHGLAIAGVVGAAETLLMVALATQLSRFNQPSEVLAIVTPFYLLYAFSLTPALVQITLRQFAEAMGHPWAPMVITLGSVALNGVINWLLIYGHLGFPALGLTGAGLATLIARFAGMAGLHAWLCRHEGIRTALGGRSLRDLGEPGWWRGYARPRFREMLAIGLPASGMLVFESTAFAFSGIMMGWLGSVPLAAHQIGITCTSLAFMIPLGLSMAAGMRVTHVVGADERERLRPIGFGVLVFGIAVMLVFAGVFSLAGRTIGGWFVRDPAVIVLAAQLLFVGAFFQLADGVQVIAAHLLRGVSDVKLPTVITLIAYWGIALPVGYLLGVRGPLGAPGIWIGIAGGLAFAAVFLTVRFAWLTRMALT
jgi:MATE family multidrug resistance protein